jgi:hypothetical protein
MFAARHLPFRAELRACSSNCLAFLPPAAWCCLPSTGSMHQVNANETAHQLRTNSSSQKRTIICSSENLEAEKLPGSAEDHRAVLPPLSK